MDNTSKGSQFSFGRLNVVLYELFVIYLIDGFDMIF